MFAVSTFSPQLIWSDKSSIMLSPYSPRGDQTRSHRDTVSKEEEEVAPRKRKTALQVFITLACRSWEKKVLEENIHNFNSGWLTVPYSPRLRWKEGGRDGDEEKLTKEVRRTWRLMRETTTATTAASSWTSELGRDCSSGVVQLMQRCRRTPRRRGPALLGGVSTICCCLLGTWLFWMIT